MRWLSVSFALALVATLVLAAPRADAQTAEVPPVVGRWDIKVNTGQGTYPSWVEIHPSGFRLLVGRFVGQFGSSRPISEFHYEAGTLSFSAPLQWEQGTKPLYFEGKLEGNGLSGWTTDGNGAKYTWTAVRAPELPAPTAPKWGKPIALFNGKDLNGWTTRGGRESKWAVRDKILVNSAPGSDLMTTAKFKDFKLHVEFRYPANGNSGIYLRGRHEVQISDIDSRGVRECGLAGVYGFLAPNVILDSKPNEWHAYDITLLGRTVTIVLDGKTVICEQEIPGITGGALDTDEGAPGPIFLQGDHTAVDYRSIVLTPAE
jgi:hypothetical protein